MQVRGFVGKMAFQSALLRLLGVCTVLVALATVIMAANEETIQDNVNELQEDLAPQVQLSKRDVVEDWLDFMDKRGRSNSNRVRVSS